MPFSDSKKVNAQGVVNYGAVNSGSGSGDSTSMSGYITGLASTITQFPGCKAAFGKNIKNLFNSNGSSFGEHESSHSTGGSSNEGENFASGTEETIADEGTLSDASSNAMSQANAVPIYDAMSEKIKEDTSKILKYSVSIEKSTVAVDENQNCWNAIGKAVIKLLIQKMTLSIVNWIQTGNSGGPFFVQNPSKFFADIAKNEILGFGLEINDSIKYPFGKAFMQNIANSFNNKFADNAQYSLDQMIQSTNPQYSAITFSADFSQGGWNAWNAMVQNPANNPLGFQLMASNELQARLAGTIKSPAEIASDLLDQSGGFLGDERCTEPWGITREQNQRFLNGETKTYTDATTGHTMIPVKCEKWEYVTPGAVIGHTLTKSMDDNANSLLSAETLNDAIAAILDATMARFSSELTSKGLAAMSTSNDTASEQVDLGNLFPTDTDTGTQFASSYVTPWIQNHPGFDIKTGITQALVDEQRTYLEKLTSYNTALADLIKWIRQLDYCIPGPNPDWYTTSLEIIQNEDGIGATTSWFTNTDSGQILGSLNPTGISSIIGEIHNETKARKSARLYIQELFGVNIYEEQDEVFDQNGVNALLNTVFKNYKKIINEVYFSPNIWGPYNWTGIEYMPGVTLESRAEFKKIAGYQQIIENNYEDSTFRKSIITRLINLKEKIDTATNNGTINSLDLDNPASQTVTEFARLSTYLVSGDDIANIDNLYNQAKDEKNYVKTDLLEGAYGCEKFMQDLWTTKPIIYKTYARRQPYPFPIDHHYAPAGNNTGPKPFVYSSGKTLMNEFGTNWANEGFLYGSVYYNNAADPYSGQYGTNICPEFIHTIDFYTGLSSNTSDNTDPIANPGAIGGLKKYGYGPTLDNTCNVLTRPLGFERKFGIY